jgi:hypothetical protein
MRGAVIGPQYLLAFEDVIDVPLNELVVDI